MTLMVLPPTIHHLGGFAEAPLEYSNQYRIDTEKRACFYLFNCTCLSRLTGNLKIHIDSNRVSGLSN
jgi:hypothetical protein